MSFSIGNTVGPYRIVDQIGQGGMATVYKAYHANLDRYVAFKVLHPAFKEDTNFLERFKREAQIVAKLEHPSIVPVYDYADFEGQPYLVMKFIEGETLKARLKRQPLTLPETIAMLTVVADALTFAHNRGILHRDIKPSNIMLDRDDKPFIADFGLARIAQAGESTLSQDMMLGTPQYISPEQAKGLQDLGPGTDIYSLGVVLYEILVGRVPFSADTPYAIVHDHIYKPLPLPSKINPQVPQELERVLLKALAKEPLDRYETAVDMAEDFRQAVADAGLTDLSAATYRAQAPVSSSAATMPPDRDYTPPEYEVVPSPVMQPTGSSASRQTYRRRANLWILGGFGALLTICLASLFIILSAVSDPDLRPWDTGDTAGAEGEPDSAPPAGDTRFFAPDGITVEQALETLAQNPDDPRAYFALAWVYHEANDFDSAARVVGQALERFEQARQVAAQVAQTAAAHGQPRLAVWLYLEVLNQPAAARDPIAEQAAQFLLSQSQQNARMVLDTMRQFVTTRPANPTVLSLQALILLRSEEDPERVEGWQALNQAFATENPPPEAFLVRGLYHYHEGRLIQARQDWQVVKDALDLPAWVRQTLDQIGDPTEPGGS